MCYCRSQWNLTLDRAGDLLSGAELDPVVVPIEELWREGI